jgi:hypothetical protein
MGVASDAVGDAEETLLDGGLTRDDGGCPAASVALPLHPSCGCTVRMKSRTPFGSCLPEIAKLGHADQRIALRRSSAGAAAGGSGSISLLR